MGIEIQMINKEKKKKGNKTRDGGINRLG